MGDQKGMNISRSSVFIILMIFMLCIIAISCTATGSFAGNPGIQKDNHQQGLPARRPKSLLANSDLPSNERLAELTQVTKTGDRYQNQTPRYQRTFTETASIVWQFLFANPADNSPSQAIPVKPVSIQQLQALAEDQVHLIRMGHSTNLLKIYGQYWITDPMFSERASPFQSLGPKRFHRPPIAWSELLDGIELAGVIISHNHYDHLDENSIRQLSGREIPILLPMGVAKTVQSWGVASSQTIEFNWWDQLTVAGVTLTATPSQHFSGRRFDDENKTLWLSWVIEHPDATIFFSGDGGYFPGFKQIGDFFESIDIALMEAGAYNRHWPDMHLFPEQTVAAHQDLNGQWLVPIHNTTFDLSMHPWQDPMEKIADLAQQQNVEALFPKVGQVLSFRPDQTGLQLELPRTKLLAWWKQVIVGAE